MRKHSHSSEGSPLRCYENRFCSSLDPDTRRRLCQACTKSTYAANSKATMNFYRHFLVVKGLCLTKRFRTSFVYCQGDFVITHYSKKQLVRRLEQSIAKRTTIDASPEGLPIGRPRTAFRPCPKRARGVLPTRAPLFPTTDRKLPGLPPR